MIESGDPVPRRPATQNLVSWNVRRLEDEAVQATPGAGRLGPAGSRGRDERRGQCEQDEEPGVVVGHSICVRAAPVTSYCFLGARSGPDPGRVRPVQPRLPSVRKKPHLQASLGEEE